MYERAVTLAYLHEHPSEEQKFRNYGKVSQHKLLKIVEESFGADVFSPEQKAKIEREFQQVREQFLVTDCKECGTYRLNHSWSKLDVVSMARTSPPLWKIIVPAYYSGLREGHSTIGAIFSRLDASSAAAGEGLIFGGESQPETADIALSMAHRIILIVLDQHKDHFNLDALGKPLQKCFADFEKLWKER
jgi:hypothetical protein